MSLVLAIEPDLRQAAILQRVIQEKVHADVVVVDSRDAAIAAVNAQIPDVLLLSALLSPRDEDELIAHLRGLGPDAEHLQTHTIPQLASSAGKAARGKGLLSAFRKKKDVEQTAGCDPDLFADEVRSFVKRAAEMKAEAVAELQSRVHELEYKVQSQTPLPAAPSSPAARAGANAPEQPAADASSSAGGSAWDSPFEWRRAAPPARVGHEEPVAPPPMEEPEPPPVSVLQPEPAAEAAAAPVEDVPLVEPVRYMDDLPEPALEEHSEEMPVDAPAVEEIAQVAAPVEDPAPVVLPEPEPVIAADAPEISIFVDEPLPEPVIEAPAPKRRRKSSSKRGSAAVVRLTPLAMWARSEAPTAATAKSPADAGDRTTADELRDLMAGLSIPPHVAAVSYARGCRIRRVRVPAGTRQDGGDVPGPVILSKRALSDRRAGSAR